MKYIPINNGFFNYKSINNECFKTRVKEKSYKGVKIGCDTITIEGRDYIVGQGRPNFSKDKSNNFSKICILDMLGRFTESEESFKISLTTQPDIVSSQRAIMPKFLKGQYNIIHNDKPKKIIIEDVLVFPETIAAYVANNPKQFKDKILLLLDIGGVTTNGVLIKNNSFNPDDIFSIPNGMYHLDSKVCDYLNSKYYSSININVDDMDFYRDKGLFLDKNENINILDTEKEYINDNIYIPHIDKILEKCYYKGWTTIKSFDVLVTGGGGKVLFNTITKPLPKAKLSADPLYDNVKGLQILMKQVYSNDYTS